MFESYDEDAEIKVIDFGLSKKYSPNRRLMNEGVGTIYTMAPEVLRGSYTSQADMWSTGVITFMLLANEKPFKGKKRKKVVQKIMQNNYNFDKPIWERLSQDSKDFVGALLEVNPKKRLSATEALEHEWQQKKFSLNDRAPSQEILSSCHESIENYRGVSAFKKMALMVIAHKSTRSDILELRKVFDSMDTANNGSVSFEEFRVAMQKSKSNYTEEEIKHLFQNVDMGNDGRIYYTEFLAATLGAHGRILEERLAGAFDRLDSDDTGYISRENLREILGVDYTEEKVDQLLKEGDLTGDGKISFEEFRKAFIAPQEFEMSTRTSRSSASDSS
jgi:Ca2+-binding EF-hand superfamily protein